jgi:hypothetical protein
VPATVTLVPPGVALAALALAEREGAATAVFYLFLLAIVVSAASGLAGFGRLVDVANGGGTPVLGRLQAALAALLVAVLVAGAVSRSPVALELDAPGLAPVAIATGLILLAAQAFLSLVAFAGEAYHDVRLDRRALSLHADAAEGLDASSVR